MAIGPSPCSTNAKIQTIIRFRYCASDLVIFHPYYSSRPIGREEPEYGGGGGIRTHVTGNTGETVFETAAFSRSATLPRMIGAKPRMKRASGARE